ncbi:MAG TPA: COX15/CtaA family protein [Acidimicrobiales bacterium]|nr:COX15/CtaA family protein [Acidimicrobiales bacterium]
MQAFLRSPRTFLRIAQVNLVVVALNIVSGGAVRLTDSGLGCPDWPACTRHRLTAPLSLHPMIEFTNRLVVVAVTVLAALALVAALRRRPRRRDLVWLSAGLVGGILAEAVIGAVVVYTKLNPFAVMTHFVIGILVLTDAIVLALRAGRSAAPGTLRIERGLLWPARAMVGLLFVAVAAGTATTGAGPHAGGKAAARLDVPLTDMTRVHSGLVLLLVALTVGTLWRLARSGAPAAVLERGRWLILAMVVQGVIGYTQYFSHLPALLVGVHILGATTVWTAVVWFYDGLWLHEPEPAAAADAAPGGDGRDRHAPATAIG